MLGLGLGLMTKEHTWRGIPTPAAALVWYGGQAALCCPSSTPMGPPHCTMPSNSSVVQLLLGCLCRGAHLDDSPSLGLGLRVRGSHFCTRHIGDPNCPPPALDSIAYRCPWRRVALGVSAKTHHVVGLWQRERSGVESAHMPPNTQHVYRWDTTPLFYSILYATQHTATLRARGTTCVSLSLRLKPTLWWYFCLRVWSLSIRVRVPCPGASSCW